MLTDTSPFSVPPDSSPELSVFAQTSPGSSSAVDHTPPPTEYSRLPALPLDPEVSLPDLPSTTPPKDSRSVADHGGTFTEASSAVPPQAMEAVEAEPPTRPADLVRPAGALLLDEKITPSTATSQSHTPAEAPLPRTTPDEDYPPAATSQRAADNPPSLSRDHTDAASKGDEPELLSVVGKAGDHQPEEPPTPGSLATRKAVEQLPAESEMTDSTGSSVATQTGELLATPEEIRLIHNLLEETGLLPPESVNTVRALREPSESANYAKAFFAQTAVGLDVTVRQFNPDTTAFRASATRLEVTPWQDCDSRFSKPSKLNSGYTLRNLLVEQKCIHQDASGRWFEMRAFSSADGYNGRISMLGKQPGVDVFRLVDTPGGYFSDPEYVEATARGEILRATSGKLHYIEHDRELTSHMLGWWSMPSAITQRLRQRAQEVDDEGDPTAISTFAGGIEGLLLLSRENIPILANVLDRPWVGSAGVSDKLAYVKDTMIRRSRSIGNVKSIHLDTSSTLDAYKNNASVNALLKTGLIEERDIPFETDTDGNCIWPKGKTVDDIMHTPEANYMRGHLTDYLALYAINIIDTLLRVDHVMGTPPNVNLDDRQRLANELEEYFLRSINAHSFALAA